MRLTPGYSYFASATSMHPHLPGNHPRLVPSDGAPRRPVPARAELGSGAAVRGVIGRRAPGGGLLAGQGRGHALVHADGGAVVVLGFPEDRKRHGGPTT